MSKRLNFRTPLRNLFQWLGLPNLKDLRKQKEEETACEVCNGSLKNIRLEPGTIVQVCKKHLGVPQLMQQELRRHGLKEGWEHQMVNDPLKPEGSEVVVEGKMYGLPECKMETGQFPGLAVSEEERQAVEDRNQINRALMEHLKKQVLSRERAQVGGTRFSIMLWEVRFLLRSLGKSNPKAKTLGDELESYMEEERPGKEIEPNSMIEVPPRELKDLSTEDRHLLWEVRYHLCYLGRKDPTSYRLSRQLRRFLTLKGLEDSRHSDLLKERK